MEQFLRWHDKHKKFSEQLNELRVVNDETRDKAIRGVLALMRDQGMEKVLEDFLLDFPLDLFRRRWYDKDPYLWLMVNSLKYSSTEMLDMVADYLEKVLHE